MLNEGTTKEETVQENTDQSKLESTPVEEQSSREEGGGLVFTNSDKEDNPMEEDAQYPSNYGDRDRENPNPKAGIEHPDVRISPGPGKPRSMISRRRKRVRFPNF